MGISENVFTLLRVLAEYPERDTNFPNISGSQLVEFTGLSSKAINEAATLLVSSGFAEWIQTLGSAPYNFSSIGITARGLYEYEQSQIRAEEETDDKRTISRPVSPVGSPFGFTDQDFEIVSDKKADFERLFVVLGYQFNSEFYDSDKLVHNVHNMFVLAIDNYNKLPGSIPVGLVFQPLSAGYGEHLFNEIARDIISSDIAVFETSDLNPNVMVELGVALTWGVRVLPIMMDGQQKPVSDISGQTWASYTSDAESFTDVDHQNKLLRMVERAARKKGHS